VRKRSRKNSIPDRFRTKAGVEVVTNDGVWDLSDGLSHCKVDFSKIAILPPLLYHLKEAIASYAMSHATDTIKNVNAGLRNLNWHEVSTNEITIPMIAGYFRALDQTSKWKMGALKAFLKFWHKSEISGLEDGLIDFLDELVVPGNEKGNAVATMHPVKGPLIDLEVQAILVRATQLLQKREISLRQFALLRTLLISGGRAKSICLLTYGHMRQSETSQQTLAIPNHKRPKKVQLEIPLPHDLFVIFQILRKNDILKLGSEHIETAPLFPASNAALLVRHHSIESLRLAIKQIGKTLNLKTPRSNDPINLNSRRFRYTLGTRAGEEGASMKTIAWVLDHADVQNVQVYFGNAHSISDRLDRALAESIAPILNLFKGTIIADPADAMNADRKECGITNEESEHIGQCGTCSDCHQRAPIACYTCPMFQPFIDAPHEQLRDSLIADRDDLIAAGDKRMAAILDSTILAISQVILMCRPTIASASSTDV